MIKIMNLIIILKNFYLKKKNKCINLINIPQTGVIQNSKENYHSDILRKENKWLKELED